MAMDIDGVLDFDVRRVHFAGFVLRARSVRSYTTFMGRCGNDMFFHWQPPVNLAESFTSSGCCTKPPRFVKANSSGWLSRRSNRSKSSDRSKRLKDLTS
jgi:hypothetical protein